MLKMIRYGAVIIIVVLISIEFIESARGRFKKDKLEQSEDQSVMNTTQETIHNNAKELQSEASIVTACIFFFLMIGMFLCCRYVPDFIMDKCNC